jgi:hypothetical protein
MGCRFSWVTLVAISLQTIFNLELMRYTLATGEPCSPASCERGPSSTLWAWIYAVLYFLQVGWPAWAGTAAGAIFLPRSRKRIATAADAGVVYGIGISRLFLGASPSFSLAGESNAHSRC